MQSEAGETEKVFPHCSWCQFTVQLPLMSQMLRSHGPKKKSKADKSLHLFIRVCPQTGGYDTWRQPAGESHPSVPVCTCSQRRENGYFVDSLPGIPKDNCGSSGCGKEPAEIQEKLGRGSGSWASFLEKEANDHAHSPKQHRLGAFSYLSSVQVFLWRKHYFLHFIRRCKDYMILKSKSEVGNYLLPPQWEEVIK